MQTEINDEIILQVISEYKKTNEEDQIKLITLLSIEDSMKILVTMHSILNTIYDKEIMKFATLTYNILLKRINNIKNNKKILCSKKEKHKIDNLYIMLLENKPVKNNEKQHIKTKRR